jgi:hypothetical protein
MNPTRIHLMDLVRRYQASSAEWKYVELITDEYIAHQVNKRLEEANEHPKEW